VALFTSLLCFSLFSEYSNYPLFVPSPSFSTLCRGFHSLRCGDVLLRRAVSKEVHMGPRPSSRGPGVAVSRVCTLGHVRVCGVRLWLVASNPTLKGRASRGSATSCFIQSSLCRSDAWRSPVDVRVERRLVLP
jgi:hypothetical protein